MRNPTRHIRHGVGSVRPYLYGRLDMLELVKRAFGGGRIRASARVGKGAHVEAKIGDSIVVMEVCDPPHPQGTTASIYVYVEDVDASYERAIGCRRDVDSGRRKTSPTRNAPPALKTLSATSGTSRPIRAKSASFQNNLSPCPRRGRRKPRSGVAGRGATPDSAETPTRLIANVRHRRRQQPAPLSNVLR